MADPTPQQRADYIVRKLEQFIRDDKSERGMPFKTWQGMARAELANAFADVERRHERARRDITARRLLLAGSTALATIGFWGGVLAIDRSYGGLAAAVLLVAGLVLLVVGGEAGGQRLVSRGTDRRRRRSFERIEDFDHQLRQLEGEIWRLVERTKEKAREAEQASRPGSGSSGAV